MTDAGAEHSWNLNGATGAMIFPNGICFEAAMRYRFMPATGGGFRVTTLSYLYSLKQLGEERFLMHWHPRGRSHETRPHLHLPLPGGSDSAHYQSPRMTFEDAVQWVIQYGVTPARDDWREVLESSRSVHVRYRTWHGNGPDANAQGTVNEKSP
ncbi:hypothetical protein [Microbacterium sp.]|uniref:hypothetical protein n=1 Tax=Microbacterium sp. TaxID=51671 RepID=UPI003F727C63